MDTIGFIGLGLMGRPMALNLRRRGFPLVVHNRSRGAVEALVSAGATAADSPADVARRATRIVLMLPDSPEVGTVLEGPAGVLGAIQRGTVVIDSSTIAPAAAQRFVGAAATFGATYLDAPVSGGEIGAIEGTLTFMIGGDAAAVDSVRPVLAAMGHPDRIVHVGPSGAGQICKVCNQLVIGGTLAVVSEAVALARKSGVDPARVRTALLGGFAASRVLDVHGERMITGNYTPGFRGRLYAKDMRIAMATLAEHGVPAPATALAHQLVEGQMAAGEGDDDYSAVARVIFRLAGLE